MNKSERIAIPEDQRVDAGQRVKQRREALGLSATTIAEAVELSVPGVYRWEREGMPASMRVSQVTALEGVLQTSRYWLLFGDIDGAASELAQARLAPEAPISIQADTLIEAIRSVGEVAVSARNAIRRESWSAKGERDAIIFAQRYGVLGSEASTLDAIGMAQGFTRQRAQQIVDKMVENAGALSYQIAVVDILRSVIRDLLPTTVGDLAARLKPLLGDGLHVEDANRFCIEILGLRLFALSEKRTGPQYDRFERLAISPDSYEEDCLWAQEVHAHALAMIRAGGAAHLATVIGQVVLAGVQLDTTRVVGVLKSNKGFAWLAERDGWFWFGEGLPARNPLLTATREVLTASGGRVDIAEILGGIATVQASWARRDDPRLALAIAPPAHVVRALFDQVPWLSRIQYDDYFLREEEDPAALSEGEKLVLAVLNEMGGIASRSMLQSRLVVSGEVPSVTLDFVLETSPIFRPVTRGVVGVRGRDYPVQAVLMAVETTFGKTPYIATGLSVVSFPFEMTAFAARQNVCVAPAGVVSMLEEGSYKVEGTNATIDLVQRQSGVFALNRAVQCMAALGIEVGQKVEINVRRKERVVSFRPVMPSNGT